MSVFLCVGGVVVAFADPARGGRVQVVVRLFVAPYGNAGVSVNDPEADAANFATHPRKRVRRAPADDLLGLAREPPDDAPPDVVRCLATTDQMELQVQP